MKKVVLAGLIVVAVALTLARPSEADGRHGHFRGHFHHRPVFHSRVIIGFGPGYYWGPYPYAYYPPPYVVYSPPPVVVQETPPVYIEQTPPAPAPPAAAASDVFWYYCQSANGYYPTVPSCPEAWVKVPPRP